MKKNLLAYYLLFVRSVKVLFGRSYYHVHKTIGKHIVPNTVEGYYVDYSEKANWTGELDSEGIPIVVLSNDKRIYFPITIAQMALGHYELWLEDKNKYNREYFLKLSIWLRDNQDENGAWTNPWEYLRPLSVSNYSAMTQGEAISVLIRAHLLTKDITFIDCANRAYNLMLKPVDEGGCSFYLDQNIYLEECPEEPRSSVLNGWIYAAFGIYDLLLFTGDDEIKKVYDNTIHTLELSLDSYDMGFWTYYDLHGLIASPYYHKLHITLLGTLYMITKIETFNTYSKKWAKYDSNILSSTKALAMKLLQRLKDPAPVSIVK